MTTKLIKSCTHSDCINIVIRRLPNAKVFGFRRTADGESLGIKRGNGTAEVGGKEERCRALRNVKVTSMSRTKEPK